MWAMEVFRFKKFSVRNERSSMKVNTDGVLLGAAMTLLPSARLLLDIGTGTGVIALMAAQRLAEARAELGSGVAGAPKVKDAPAPDFKIIGIDIDCDSASEAAENFLSSPWSDKLASIYISLSDFEKECDVAPRGFDMIFSNPPYFESSLKSPDERKRTARHADTLSYREIIAFAAHHLNPAGRLSMILPYETEREAVRYAASFNLRLFRRLLIRTTPSPPVSRVILEFVLEKSVTAGEVISDELTIQDPADRTNDNPAGYTEAYRALVHNFLLI